MSMTPANSNQTTAMKYRLSVKSLGYWLVNVIPIEDTLTSCCINMFSPGWNWDEKGKFGSKMGKMTPKYGNMEEKESKSNFWTSILIYSIILYLINLWIYGVIAKYRHIPSKSTFITHKTNTRKRHVTLLPIKSVDTDSRFNW